MSVQRYSGNVGKLAMSGTSWSFANDVGGWCGGRGPAGVSTLVNWYVGKVGYFLVGCQVRRVGRVGPAGVPRSGKSPELGAAR